MLDKSGQAGEISVFAVLVLMLAFAYLIVSPVVENVHDVTPTLSAAASWTNSQTRAMNWLFKAWHAFPFFALLVLLLWLIKRSVEKRSGEVV